METTVSLSDLFSFWYSMRGKAKLKPDGTVVIPTEDLNKFENLMKRMNEQRRKDFLYQIVRK